MTTQLPLEKLQHMGLDVLQKFHDFCEANGLVYYLSAGTLLGAIRHNGFIPWDDDLDVVMPRYDYEKFIKLFLEEQNKHWPFKLAIPSNTPNYYLPFAKLFDSRIPLIEPKTRKPCLLGPWLDIFPLDNMSDDYKKATKLFWHVKIIYQLSACRNIKPSYSKFNILIREPLAVLLHLFPRTYLLNKLNHIACRYQSSKPSKYLCQVVLGAYGMKEIMPSKWFAHRELHIFENRKFYIPTGYHDILTNLYGNYMTPVKTEGHKMTES